VILRHGREVTTLTIDSPATRNALGSRSLADLAAALAVAGADPQVRVIVITANGTVFSSGADRTELGDPAAVERIVDRLEAVLRLIAETPKPVVCRVNGDAYGAGLAIVAAADLAVTVCQARFALPEVRFGLVATVAAAVAVPRIGATAALDLMLTGRTIDGVEAARLGLVTTVVDDEPALDDLMAERLQELAAGGAEALHQTKVLVRQLVNVKVDGTDVPVG